jgi:hypothetical protein
MMESSYGYHCHHHHRSRRRHNQDHGFFKSKSLRVAHYEMQDVIGLFIINLVVPRIIVLLAANFESNLFQVFPDYFTYFLHIHTYIYVTFVPFNFL